MFDLSMFGQWMKPEERPATPVTPSKTKSVTANHSKKPNKNKDISSLLHPLHLLHPKNAMSDSEQEAFEERAAIMEYDGGLSRSEAEQQALAIYLEDYR